MGNSTTLMGLAASPGIAVGRCWLVDRRKVRTPKRRLSPEEVATELSRLRDAIESADRQLAEVRVKVEQLEGSEHTAIIDMHRLMLKDEMLVEEAQRLIREDQVNAEWAVKRAVRKIKSAFAEVADEYFKERRSDVEYVGERIIKNLMGEAVDVQEAPPEGAVIIAHDLSPADTVLLLHERKVAAFVTDAGTRTSHTAIVARALEVPAVVGVGRISWLAEERALMATSDLPATTRDGVQVRLVGNIEFAEEVKSLLDHGGEGVGLYRTEFLYMGRSDLPNEEEHYQNYKLILETLAPRPVTIRTFDLGGDKLPLGVRNNDENPALGLRALRYCLRHPDMFRTQLRALLRASVHGNLKIMFPMVSGVAELRAAKRALAEANEELRREGVETRLPPIGIMVELPSAALIADRLSQECDFLSIGTNDLIQYTMAIDRQNKDVAYLYRPLHLAVLRTLRLICDAGRQANIPVSMCGEMAGEPLYVLILLGLGMAELSMNSASIPLVKRVVRAANAEDGKRLLDRLMDLTAADEIEREVRSEMAQRFAGLLDDAGAVGPVGG